MLMHSKRLQNEVRVSEPNSPLASRLQEQFSGSDIELAKAMGDFTQSTFEADTGPKNMLLDTPVTTKLVSQEADLLTNADFGADLGAGRTSNAKMNGSADLDDAAAQARSTGLNEVHAPCPGAPSPRRREPCLEMRMATVAANETVREIFITGLRNAHALEHQALALMDRQLDHLAHYAEVAGRMRSHRGETERQIARLEQILKDFGESHSAVKDAVLTVTGNLAAVGHSFAADEILKNAFANFAFENFEIATYKALIVMAQEGGFVTAIPLLEHTLQEELAMAAFLDEILPDVVTKFLDRRSAGETASH